MNAHRVRVGHTNGDGIWLRCSCGWRKNIGHDPTVEDVIAADNDHTGWTPAGSDPADDDSDKGEGRR